MARLPLTVALEHYDRHVPLLDGTVTHEALDLTTLHVGFADDLRALLGVPRDVEVIAIVPLGYPRDRFGPTRRKPVDEVAFLDHWGVPLR